jgi:hypothetical protein
VNALLSSTAWAVSTPIVLLIGTLLLALLEDHLPAPVASAAPDAAPAAETPSYAGSG